MTATVTGRHRWTAEEDAVLRAHYGRLPRAELAARLGCTTASLHYRAGFLGLRRRQAARIRWTPETVAVLRAEYGRTPTVDLAARFGATLPAVRAQAKLHGLCGAARGRWTPDRDRTITELSGMIPAAELGRRLGVSATAVYRRLRRLGLNVGQATRTRYGRDQSELRRLRALIGPDGPDTGPTIRRLRILIAYRMGVLTEAEAAVAAGIAPGRLIVECGKEAARGQAEAIQRLGADT
jgi:AsnC-type helix-turn-helix domain